jgi:hypothetical protein
MGMGVVPPFVIAVAKDVEGQCGLCPKTSLCHKTKGLQFNSTITFATTKTATA